MKIESEGIKIEIDKRLFEEMIDVFQTEFFRCIEPEYLTQEEVKGWVENYFYHKGVK